AYVATAEGELAAKETDGRYLAQVTRNGIAIGPRDREGRGNDDEPDPVEVFLPGEEWLPTTNRARTEYRGLFIRLSMGLTTVRPRRRSAPSAA
ncbi:MAG: hypothetical protein AAF602_09475, partial [Myxococcota bacterium]